jgi:NADPH-dependent glutamate synthase beta subunit-like oxidoreductase
MVGNLNKEESFEMANGTGKYQVKTLGIEDYQALTACQNACPLGTDTKRYVKAISDGEYEKGFLIARQTNPLVSVCSRVCTAPCEKSCRKSEEGTAVDIRALKRFVCDQYGVASPAEVARKLGEYDQKDRWVSDRPGNHILSIASLFDKREKEHKNTAKGARVAIIGSGPAGLSAAHDLALLGYRPVIFEADSVAGGQLMTGIPGSPAGWRWSWLTAT